ncbi:DUF1810 domain-containing protein [Pseudomonas turukhanskensis]|uniref:Calpastatin n=1 Tax=Pseudomonas turukhanskensis TaxID=1806536 RepID=A0A9W6NEP9_9PSED|nr:DUF1810 domain-containing protein [Pseudomonas turukhanskensis]GLK88002.1 hypothetical protein GCM10017655_10640 [Pseudomonas turukhanskensis]
MADPYNLQRFVDAQASTYEHALAELEAGKKQSHWMWFIFPQLEGLGHSANAQRYGISGLDEANAYVTHPILGPRLHACAEALLAWSQRTAREIFGSPDDIKLCSSMTLFATLPPENNVFAQVLEHFFEGHADPLTLARVG